VTDAQFETICFERGKCQKKMQGLIEEKGITFAEKLKEVKKIDWGNKKKPFGWPQNLCSDWGNLQRGKVLIIFAEEGGYKASEESREKKTIRGTMASYLRSASTTRNAKKGGYELNYEKRQTSNNQRGLSRGNCKKNQVRTRSTTKLGQGGPTPRPGGKKQGIKGGVLQYGPKKKVTDQVVGLPP